MATWTAQQATAFYFKRQRVHGKFLLANLKSALRSATEIRDTAEHRQTAINRLDRIEYDAANQLRLKAQCLIEDLIVLLENDHSGACALIALIEDQSGSQQQEHQHKEVTA